MSALATDYSELEDSISAAGLQNIVPDFPEGGPTPSDISDWTGQTAGSADPSGINGVYPSHDPGINPNPTGGWMQELLQISRIGLLGLQTYENGSVSSATPRALKPATGVSIAPSSAALPAGIGMNMSTVLFVGALVLIGGVLVHQISH